MTLKRSIGWGLVGAVALNSAALAQADPPATGASWTLDHSGYDCAIAGKLVGEPPAVVTLRTLPGTGKFDLSLMSKSLPKEVLKARKQVGLKLLPTGWSHLRRSHYALFWEDAVSLPGRPAELLNHFAAAKQVGVLVGDRTVLTYSVLSPKAATKALAECEASKLIEAGADAAGFLPGAVRPEALGNKLEWADYFERMPNIYAMALVDIDTNGRASECRVLEMKGRYPRDRLCKDLLQSARYRPARDPQGSPIRSVVTLEFRTGRDVPLGMAHEVRPPDNEE
jgi:hypothetical protein